MRTLRTITCHALLCCATLVFAQAAIAGHCGGAHEKPKAADMAKMESKATKEQGERGSKAETELGAEDSGLDRAGKQAQERDSQA